LSDLARLLVSASFNTRELVDKVLSVPLEVMPMSFKFWMTPESGEASTSWRRLVAMPSASMSPINRPGVPVVEVVESTAPVVLVVLVEMVVWDEM
jgi:hypothetical protein